MKVALSGLAPVSIHMDDSSAINFLLLVNSGRTSLAVRSTVDRTDFGTNDQKILCIHLGSNLAKRYSFTKSMALSEIAMNLSIASFSPGKSM